MRLRERSIAAVIGLSLLAAASGCDDGGGPTPLPSSSAVPAQPASPTARARFKGDRVLSNDLSRDLGLEASAICNELGTHPCTSEVHKVTLGGVDAYDRQIYVPLGTTAPSTPLAAERVVLSACLERAKRDFATPDAALLFGGLPLDGAKLTDIHGEAVTASIERLYVALLARHATPGEIAAVADSYADIEASGDATPAQTWAALSCFAVGTSVEFLFY
ncbi:MAG: hypothetical protein U0414_19825 [Polyangiaceae bacterium]